MRTDPHTPSSSSSSSSSSSVDWNLVAMAVSLMTAVAYLLSQVG